MVRRHRQLEFCSKNRGADFVRIARKSASLDREALRRPSRLSLSPTGLRPRQRASSLLQKCARWGACSNQTDGREIAMIARSRRMRSACRAASAPHQLRPSFYRVAARCSMRCLVAPARFEVGGGPLELRRGKRRDDPSLDRSTRSHDQRSRIGVSCRISVAWRRRQSTSAIENTREFLRHARHEKTGSRPVPFVRLSCDCRMVGEAGLEPAKS